jgi:hypothetical protein
MSTEERLERLEREVLMAKRRTRWLLAAVGLGVVALALAWTLANTTSTAQGSNSELKMVSANGFVLQDETGKPRARLTVLKGGPMLSLLDANGTLRAMLTVDKEGAGLALGDETGKTRARLTVDTSGPGLGLLDENGKPRLTLGVSTDRPWLGLYDKTGKSIWSR